MELTEEQLNQIEEYAGVFLTLDEIALLMRLEVKPFRKEALKQGTPINEAYQRGKLTSKVEIVTSITKMAKVGSPQAQKDVIAFITAQIKNERER